MLPMQHGRAKIERSRLLILGRVQQLLGKDIVRSLTIVQG